MKRKLLIVEDELDFLQMLLLRANHRDFECITDTTGAECLDLISKKKPDAILMDLDLPKLNGIELITQIKLRDELKNLPIIVFSAFSEPDLIKEVIKLGAKTYFVKSGNTDDLLDMIEKYIDENCHDDEFDQHEIHHSL